MTESLVGNNVSDSDVEEITSFFIEQLGTEAVAQGRQLLLCPVGLVGSGKTTVLKRLEKYLSFVRVSTDEIRKYLQDEGYNLVRTEEIAIRLVEYFLENKHSVAVDADCISHRARLESIASTYTAQIIWIHINPPVEFIRDKLHRLDQRDTNHPKVFANAQEAIENLERRMPLHNAVDFPFIFTFDTSKDDLDTQVAEAVAAIKKVL